MHPVSVIALTLWWVSPAIIAGVLAVAYATHPRR